MRYLSLVISSMLIACISVNVHAKDKASCDLIRYDLVIGDIDDWGGYQTR